MFPVNKQTLNLTLKFNEVVNFCSFLTNNTDWFSDEFEPSEEANVLGPTAGRPQPYDVLDAEEAHQDDLHVKEGLVGEAGVLLDRWEHAEDQADQHHHEAEKQFQSNVYYR